MSTEQENRIKSRKANLLRLVKLYRNVPNGGAKSVFKEIKKVLSTV